MDKPTCPACGAELPAKRKSTFVVCEYCGSRYKAEQFPSITKEEPPVESAARPGAANPPFAAKMSASTTQRGSDWQPVMRRAVEDWQPAIRRGMLALPFLLPLWNFLRGGGCRQMAVVMVVVVVLCSVCFCLTGVFGISGLDMFNFRQYFQTP